MRSFSLLVVAVFMISLLVERAFAFSPDMEPVKDRGQAIFQSHCSGCHGPAGEGSLGPPLARPRLNRAKNIGELLELIRKGVPGTPMPEFEHLISKVDREKVARYVLQLGQRNQSEQEIVGDAHKGEELYRGKGQCVLCHSINGRGGTVGPDHTNVGIRGVSYLREMIQQPDLRAASNLGRGGFSNMEGQTYPDFLKVEVKTKDGKQITGVRVNEDPFTLLLRDVGGTLHSLSKSDLAEMKKFPGKSVMPSYKDVFSEKELNDLISFLRTLRSRE